MSLSLTWSQYSNTSVNFLSLCKTSCSLKKRKSPWGLMNTQFKSNKSKTVRAHLTMFLCLSSLRRHISLRAELGTPWKHKWPCWSPTLDHEMTTCRVLVNTPHHRHPAGPFSEPRFRGFLCFSPWKLSRKYLWDGQQEFKEQHRWMNTTTSQH